MKIKDYVLVSLQVALFIIYLFDVDYFPFKNSQSISILTLGITILGILLFVISLLQLRENLSPFPTPKSNSNLIKSGLYAYIRHPTYTAILLTSFGYAWFSASVYRLFISLLLIIVFYIKSKYEEKLLSQKFKEYEEYKKHTGRFIPFL